MKTMFKLTLPILFCGLIFLGLNNCKKATTETKIPTVTTSSITNISLYSATCGGNVTSDGGSSVTDRGICWSTSSSPTISNSKSSVGTGLGNFGSDLSNLQANSTYYVRAYATNSVGTAYGSEKSFTTQQDVNLATLTTNSVTNVTQTTAVCGGNISSDGGHAVTSRGVCWSTSQNPTIYDNATSNGFGISSYISNITLLSANTTYYVRAYAVNSSGTSYGNEVNFTTSVLSVVPTVVTNSVTNISQVAAICGGNVTNTGSSSVTARGVCWSTTQNPDITNQITNNGTGIGSFSSNINGLTANTIYYVRAYATNSSGTGYGAQVQFTATPGSFPNCGTVTDIDGNNYNTVQIGTQCWLKENLKTTRYRSGANLEYVIDNSTWQYGNVDSGAYCNVNFDAGNVAVYGRLYNFYAVADSKGLCPTGWHVPTDSEWQLLIDNLGGNLVAGGKMKETGTSHWNTPNTGATNESGFTGLSGGYAGNYNTTKGYFWSSSEISGVFYYRYLEYSSATIYRYYSYGQGQGNSIRCVKD